MPMIRRQFVLRALGPALLSLALPACGMHGPLDARATEVWKRSYPLSPAGELTIENANGRLDDSIRAIHKIIYG